MIDIDCGFYRDPSSTSGKRVVRKMNTFSIGTSTITTRLQSTVGKPLALRCLDVENIIKSTGLKDLKNELPVFLENIFGSNTDQGWALDLVNRQANVHDFDAVRRLLAPEGPLLSLIYQLQTDQHLNYEFPVNNLPAPSRHMIEEGGLPLFYANKLQYQGYGRPVIMLNAFECYMFHFVYCLVKPSWQKSQVSWTNLMDSLYPCLLDDYLTYFLPLNKDSLPPMPNMPLPVRSPVLHASMQSSRFQNNTTPPKPRSHLGLLRSSFTTPQKQQGSPVLGQNEPETWRSETLLQILAEFWLNQNPIETERLSGPMEHFMPGNNHVRLVRMLIKHVHHFVNTAPFNVLMAHYQNHMMSPLDEFKKSIIPQIIQKKLYAFLRHGFNRWPLDCSFRLMLETWLTYIQPWRYLPSSKGQTASGTPPRDGESELKSVEEDRWYLFIEENLLFYTVLFQEFLSRVSRMDLTTLFNACMLYRMSKVFSLPNLSAIICKAERELCSSLFRPGRGPSPHDIGGSYLSPETSLTLHTQISELERSGFQYTLMYGESLSQIQHLLKQVYQARQAVSDVKKPKSKSQKSGMSAMFDVSSWFNDDTGIYGDMTSAEVNKLKYYLDTTTKQLCSVFEIPPPEYLLEGQCSDAGNLSFQDNSFVSDGGIPDHMIVDGNITLTPRGRYQLMNRMKKFEICYQGDPDLQPIRTFENAMLVRILHHFCTYINVQFHDEIQNLYDRDSLIGRMAQVYFAPPLCNKSSPMPREMREKLERPRLSLRFLASYKVLVYLGLVYLFFRFLWGLSPVGYCFVLLALVLFIGLLRALLQPSHHVQT